MTYQGDIVEDGLLYFNFTSRALATGIPIVLAGTPALSVYKDDDLTQTITGVTLTVSVDSVVGLNNVKIDTSDVFYAIGKDYSVVLTAGTVDGNSVVGEVIGSFSIENRFDEVDAVKISGDSAAADNLEATYDGTGYTDDSAPATQSQIGSLAVGSASISTIADSYTLTTGTQSLNTVSDTETLNAVRHEHTDTAGALELYYEFNVGGAGVATETHITGRINGSNDSLDGVYAYDWLGASWDRIGDFIGTNSSVDNVNSYSLLTRHTGTGANDGKVRIRFYAAAGLSSATLRIDQIYTSYAVVSQTVGYALGRVWINTDVSNTGTELYVDGVADNPVATLAAAKTIADNLGMKDFHVSSNSTITLAADLNGYNMYGIGYTLAFAGFDVAGTHFYHAGASGILTSQNVGGHYDQLDSIIGSMTVDNAHYTNCSFNGTISLDQVNAGDLKIIDSRSIIAGSGTPVIDCGTAAVVHSITIADWQNGLEIRNLNNGGTNLFSISGTGQLIIASTCSGNMNIRGQWKITDNSGGNVTIIYDDVVTDVNAILVDTGATLPAQIISEINDVQSDIAGLNNLSRAEIMTTQMIESYSIDGAAPTLEQLLFLVLQTLTEFSISGTEITVKKLDGAATAAVLTLDDATAPTSSTRTT